jgi:hypothetical protein
MIGRLSILIIAIAISAHSVAAKPATEQSTKASTPTAGSAFDLTGYWKYGDDRVLYFKQDGSVLKSRHKERTKNHAHFADEIDFKATIRDDLVHGAHLIRLSWGMHSKCPLDLWVGMGLTLNQEHTKLTGFRGHRTVDLVTCKAKTEPPQSLVYTRMLDAEGNPLK